MSEASELNELAYNVYGRAFNDLSEDTQKKLKEYYDEQRKREE